MPQTALFWYYEIQEVLICFSSANVFDRIVTDMYFIFYNIFEKQT